MSRITPNVYTALANAMLYGPLNQADATPAEWYKYLNAYYLNNGLYDAIQQSAYAASVWTPGMKGLRNPAHRAVEFYVAKIWPGALPDALPIVTENEKIVAPIQQFWKWGNWAAGKQVAARNVSEYGDWFAKVSSNSKVVGGATVPATRIFPQNIKPEHVVDFETDERGSLTYIRIERNATKTVNGKKVSYIHVETWDNNTQLFKRWELTGGQNSIDAPPAQITPFEQLGVDFVPIVHAVFQDIGEPSGRGVGCFVHALDKIDEVNRMATRLHQILFRFNKPTTAVSANSNDASGRPLPAPTLPESTSGMTEVPDSDIWRMPGMSKLEFLVPNLQYDAYLNAVKDQMNEIKQDLPEIKYFELDASGDISGKAIRLLLGDAVDKVVEVRGSMESALARLDCMALTIMQNSGLVSGLGTFDNGDFEHTFAERDVIAISAEEKQDMDLAFWDGWSKMEGGSVSFVGYAKSMGKNDKFITEQVALMGGKKLADKTAVSL